MLLPPIMVTEERLKDVNFHPVFRSVYGHPKLIESITLSFSAHPTGQSGPSVGRSEAGFSGVKLPKRGWKLRTTGLRPEMLCQPWISASKHMWSAVRLPHDMPRSQACGKIMEDVSLVKGISKGLLPNGDQ